MLGTNTGDYVHPDDWRRGSRNSLRLWPSPASTRLRETRVRRKDGTWHWLEGMANNLLEDPSVRGLVFDHRDVTGRKQAERELVRRAAELASSSAELEQFA